MGVHGIAAGEVPLVQLSANGAVFSLNVRACIGIRR